MARLWSIMISQSRGFPAVPAGSGTRSRFSPTIRVVRDARWIVRQWDDARRTAERSDRGAVLVFDEIQKIGPLVGSGQGALGRGSSE